MKDDRVHKSVGNYNRARDERRKREINDKMNFIKKAKLAIAFAISVLLGAGSVEAAQAIKDNSIIDSGMQTGIEMVHDNTARTNDGNGYFYNENDIAGDLMQDSDHFDENIYGIYSAIPYNKVVEMNKIMSECNQRDSNYPDDFVDYVKSVNPSLIKDDGTVDTKSYEQWAQNLVLTQENFEQAQGKTK